MTSINFKKEKAQHSLQTQRSYFILVFFCQQQKIAKLKIYSVFYLFLQTKHQTAKERKKQTNKQKKSCDNIWPTILIVQILQHHPHIINFKRLKQTKQNKRKEKNYCFIHFYFFFKSCVLLPSPSPSQNHTTRAWRHIFR